MTPATGRIAVSELVETGLLEQVTVEGWREPEFLAAGVTIPRIAKGQALLSSIDNAVWFRARTERIFGVRIRLEFYTPAPKRVHGYYVLPFLEGDAISARVDL
jgi:hypothetical protein